jgi:hypothetical protein
MLSGNNPYDDATLKQKWSEVCTQLGIDNNNPPGLPTNFLVYPPTALVAYIPFTLMRWDIALIINLVGITLALLVTLLLWLRMSGISLWSYQSLFILSIIFAFKGTVHALMVGQPTFYILFLCTLSIYIVLHHSSPIRAALPLAVAFIKPTMALPFALFMVYKRRWDVLFLAVGIQIFLLLITSYLWQAEQSMTEAFVGNIRLLKQLIFESGDAFYLSTLTDLSVLIHVILDLPTYLYDLLQYGSILIVGGLLLVVKSKLSDTEILALLMLYSLCLGYHLFYDMIMLIPLVLLIVNGNYKHNWVLVLITIPAMLPINGILMRLNLMHEVSILSLHLPFVCMAMMIWYINVLRNKKAIYN